MVLYRLIASVAGPVFALRLVLAFCLGRLSWRSLCERLGRAPRALRGCDRILWLHGASNGELAAVRWIAETALARAPDLCIVVTCNTETGRALAESWGHPRLRAALAPLDHRLILARFCARARPRAHLFVENELWPNRLAALAARRCPALMVGARLSEKSARRWARFPRLARAMMRRLTYVSALDGPSEARLLAMGLAPERLGARLNLKAGGTEGGRVAPSSDDFAALFPKDRTLLAASTHAGEEGPLLDAFEALWRADRRWRLILAPRHARRGEEVAAEIAARGLPYARRGAGEPPRRDAPVYLADTMGEMALWYGLAGATFVGGSLVPLGGHTPFEPAQHGSAILFGPSVVNNGEAYGALVEADAAIAIETAADLASALARLDRPGEREAMVRRARGALDRLAPADGAAALFSALAGALGLPSLAPDHARTA